jgi:CheY-like chemotaxis protein
MAVRHPYSPHYGSDSIAPAEARVDDPLIGRRVMVVDDNAFIRQIVRTRFEASGFAVCDAVDGAEAVKQAKEEAPDLIILDLSMPVMNGLEAARALRILVPQVPLLMFTNMAVSTVERDARAAGVSAVVSKSESTDILISQARKLLS